MATKRLSFFYNYLKEGKYGNPCKEFENYQRQWYIEKDKTFLLQRDKNQYKCVSIKRKLNF